ncbi:PEPxxWA-CTERM sorting domain-containing protein [Phenylobacterium sp.]|uniref:PEPxxWA-CTERM sorting domain-containing protein n=1 Tax=Phenylobacterium sp. TaxID=1871053 RepID=UPI002ED9DF26
MSKSVAVSAKTVAAGPSLMALALALTVSAVVLAPTPALAKKDDKPAGGASTPTPAATLPLCTLADLSVGASACSGFFEGNLLSDNSSDLSAQASGLAAIGLANWNGQLVEPQFNLSSSTVDFQTALNGATWIGLHFGNGADSPSPGTPGGVTAFYRFDAGVNLDTFTVQYGSFSGVRLYSTGPAPLPPVIDPPGTSVAVPEPAAWALMIMGFGAAGAMLRRRRAAALA